MIKMKIVNIQEVLPTNAPVVLLGEEEGERLLPIFIGRPEATAIGLALADQRPPRPMTHDLLASMVETFGWQVERVVITDLQEKTFFAEIYFRGPVGVEVVPCRPSDALALAVRSNGEIYVEEKVLDQAGYLSEDDDSGQSEEEVEEFRAFLDNVNPDDFAGGDSEPS
ncbi:MAG TPA: bifunctional nuclease family protein [Acidimicrobiia bacterium]|jgi:uncharacterized protein|nr:bifunctional nuclease family protein [Acidimicrobiia bacterium]HIL45636.1 bifunctional nuclease family protein [Acidimicrobiia bacterium]